MERKKRSGIQLCYPLEERRLTDPKFGWTQNFPVIVQPKLDGVRCRAICTSHNPTLLLSSTKSIIKSVPHVNKALDRLNITIELDGELYIHGENFETVNSIVSRTVNIHEESLSTHYHVFDTVADKSQLERLIELKSLKNLDWPIEIVPTELAYTFQDIMKIYEKFLSLNYEGIIVRHRLASYIRRRSTFILKFKPKKSDVYKIVGTTQMFNKDGFPVDLLGALTCTSDEGTIFSVGSGMTTDFRFEAWKDPETLIGRYCKISYQHMTAKGSPRFPIFVSILDENPEEELEFSEGIL